MLYIAVGIIIFLYCLNEIWDYLRIMRHLNKMKGPKCSSFIYGNGDVLSVPPELLHHNLKKLWQDFYPQCRLRTFYVPAVFIWAPEDIELFLSGTKHTSKSILYAIFRRWLRDGLLLSSGDKWQRRRKILTPAFHFNILKEFINVFNERTDDFLNVVAAEGTKEINILPHIQEFSLQAIEETAMGRKTTKNDDKHTEYHWAIHKMEELFNQLIRRPWLHLDFVYMLTPFYRKEKKILKILHAYTETIIKERMDQADNLPSKNLKVENDEIYFGKKKRRMAMLDILLEARKDGHQIDYQGICEEVDTFTFEGHDTVSTALGFFLMLIANHPEIQAQLLEEINSVLGEEVRHPAYEDLQSMDLLERCIKETLRLYPSVHLISRKVDEDTKLHSGLIAPRGSHLAIPIMSVHRNPDIYPDPEKFDPDRFLPDNCQNRHPFAYIPFSAGPRNCIGQRFAMLEMKVVLSAVIRNFELIAVDTPETIELGLGAILRSSNGIRMKFIPRASTLKVQT